MKIQEQVKLLLHYHFYRFQSRDEDGSSYLLKDN
jgi:hypothetical protein